MLKLSAPFKYILVWFILFVSFVNHAVIFNNRMSVESFEDIILHESIMTGRHFLVVWLLYNQRRVNRPIIGIRMMPAINEVTAPWMLIRLNYLIDVKYILERLLVLAGAWSRMQLAIHFYSEKRKMVIIFL